MLGAVHGRSRVASAILDIGETSTFHVSYQSSLARKSHGEVRLSVVDNQYDDCVIHLVAESYQQDVSVDVVTSPVTQRADDVDEVTTVDDDLPAGLYSTHVCYDDDRHCHGIHGIDLSLMLLAQV